MPSFNLLASATKKALEVVSELVKVLEEIVTKGEKTYVFISKAREKKRLRGLLGKLLHQRYSQGQLPWMLRSYCNYRDQRRWESVISRLTYLNDNVAEILEVLENEDGDFPIQFRDTFVNLLFGMKNRKELYDNFLNMPPPSTEEDFDAILKISEYYEKLINQLAQADSNVANFLTEGEEKSILTGID